MASSSNGGGNNRDDTRRKSIRPRRLAWIASLTTLLLIAGIGVFTIGKSRDASTNATDLKAPFDTVVTAGYDGRVLLLRASDGSPVRVLANGLPGTGGLGLTRSPDGKTVHFVILRPGKSETERIEELARVPTAGGPVTTVIQGGREPAISPDGRRLAYTTIGDGSGLVVVRDLETGQERSFPTPRSPIGFGSTGITDMTWLTDSRRLVLSTADPVSLSHGDGPETPSRAYINVLDTEGDPQLLQIAPDLPGGTALWITRGPGTNTVSYIDASRPPDATVRMMALEVNRVSEPRQLFELPRPVVQAFVDPAGKHLLYLHNSRLYRRSGDKTYLLASGQQVMAW